MIMMIMEMMMMMEMKDDDDDDGGKCICYPHSLLRCDVVNVVD